MRSVEVWLRGNESKLSAQDIEALRRRLGELQAEAKKRRLGSSSVSGCLFS